MDQVKQQVWIAEALIDQYSDILRCHQAWSAQNGAECHVLIGEIERVYPGIWEQLDSAATLTTGAGRDADAYTRLRARPDLVTTNALASVTSARLDRARTPHHCEQRDLSRPEGEAAA